MGDALSESSGISIIDRFVVGGQGVVLQRLGNASLLIVLSGRDSEAQAFDRLTGSIEREFARVGALHVFADLRAQTGIDFSARDRATAWIKANRDAVTALTVCTSSKLIDMALSLITLGLTRPVLRSTSSEGEFLKLLRARAPGFQKLPAPMEVPSTRGR